MQLLLMPVSCLCAFVLNYLDLYRLAINQKQSKRFNIIFIYSYNTHVVGVYVRRCHHFMFQFFFCSRIMQIDTRFSILFRWLFCVCVCARGFYSNLFVCGWRTIKIYAITKIDEHKLLGEMHTFIILKTKKCIIFFFISF